MPHDPLSNMHRFSRRDVPKIGIAASLPLGLGVFGGTAAAQDANTPTVDRDALLPATPSIVDDDDITPDQTEGPYYTPDSPERTSLREGGLEGSDLTVAGFVVDTAGQVIPEALVDFWHADDEGVYDNEGYRLRGHQFTDKECTTTRAIACAVISSPMMRDGMSSKPFSQGSIPDAPGTSTSRSRCRTARS